MHRYPENTLIALQAAMDVGAEFVEFDVQLSADATPMLFHDELLERTTGRSGRVLDFTAEALSLICPSEPERFAGAFQDLRIPTLAQAVSLLNRAPPSAAFVEIKRHSLSHFGIPKAIGRVVEVMNGAHFPWILISFVDDALRHARQHHQLEIGWVLRQFDAGARQHAEELKPEYLFCNVTKLPSSEGPVWQGPWRWVIYDIEDPEQALALARNGVAFIESAWIGELLQDQRLAPVEHSNA
jgi:glycerophosphoryl diester phosphodiesterase